MSAYKSQMGQDKFLNSVVFHAMRDGVFVDVGAHDGESLSNTFFFEKELGWTGLCIEPIPEVFDKCNALRINSRCYKLAIDKEEAKKEFMLGKGYPEMFSVLTDHLDPRHYQRVQNETRERGGEIVVIPVNTVPLQKLLDENKISHVNYMSIDVEGAEFAVLESIDFSKVFFDVIEVECNYEDLKPKYKAFFESKGFVELVYLDWDILYIHKQSKFYEQFATQQLPYHLSIFTPPWKEWRNL